MGYHFTIEGVGYHEEPMTFDGEPIFEDDGVTPVMETVSDEPEMQLSYVNGSVLFSVLGIPEPADSCGTFAVEYLPELRRRIVSAKNGELPNRELSQKDNLVIAALTSERLLLLLEILERMAIRAQELGRPIQFA